MDPFWFLCWRSSEILRKNFAIVFFVLVLIQPHFKKVLKSRSSKARAAVRDFRGRYFLMKAIIIWRGDRDEILLGREVIFRFDDYIFGEHLRRAGTEPRAPQAPFADLYVFKHIN